MQQQRATRALTKRAVRAGGGQWHRFDTIFEAWAYFDLDGDWELTAHEFRVLSAPAPPTRSTRRS